MSLTEQPGPRRVVFVSRNLAGESLRSAEAVAKLAGVSLLGVSEDAPDNGRQSFFAELVKVTDVHDPAQLIAAARGLAARHGELDRIVTTTETLLEPAARVCEALGLQGMAVDTVRRALDKSLLKSVFKEAGISTARDCVLTCNEDARRFAAEVGLPIVLKPLGGSGGLATWCIRSTDELALALELMLPSPEHSVLAEEYLQGQEISLDTITLASEPRFYSVCYYRPSILEALEDPAVQWSCIMPRDIGTEQYRDFIEQGLAAVRALSVGNAVTHMEGFLDAAGRVAFTDATLRPAGARIGPMLAFAYDMDPYLAWARAAVDGCFDGPWDRSYAVGTIFLRGTGQGQVRRVHGIDSVKNQIGEMLADGRLPRPGAPKSATYTADGYITVRHPETQAIEDALQLIARTISISYSDPEPAAPAPDSGGRHWRERLRYFDKQLNRPAWDNDSLERVTAVGEKRP
jgi:hypothetical protein